MKKGKKQEGILQRCFTPSTDDMEMTVEELQAEVTDAELDEAILDDANLQAVEASSSVLNELISSESTDDSDGCPLMVSSNY